MVSGITSNQEVNDIYKKLRLDKTLKEIILKINDQTQLEVETEFPSEGFNYEDFISKFPDDESRFGIVDIDMSNETRKDFKIVFILWCPLSCKALKKMKYSTSANHLVEELGTISYMLQADGKADITEEKIKEKLRDKFKMCY